MAANYEGALNDEFSGSRHERQTANPDTKTRMIWNSREGAGAGGGKGLEGSACLNVQIGSNILQNLVLLKQTGSEVFSFG